MAAAIALTVTTAAAQTVSVSTSTDVGVFLSQHGQPWVRHVPANTPLTGSRETGVSILDSGASVSLDVDANGVRVRETGTATAAVAALVGTTTSQPGPAPHALRLTLTPPLAGKLRIRFTATTLRLGSFARASVDVGDDGSVEWQATADGQVHVREILLASSASTQVKVTLQAHALADVLPTAYDMSLHVHYVASTTTCAVSTYGRGCGTYLEGEEIGTAAGHRVDVDAWVGVPDVPGVLLLGATQLNLPIADSGCLLLVQPLAALPFRADVLGRHRDSFTLPAPLRGRVLLQAATLWQLPVPLLQTTNGLLLDFH